MNKMISRSILILVFICLPVLSQAAKHFEDPEFSNITAIDTKKRIVVLYGQVYNMSRRVTVHDRENKFPSVRDLQAGMYVKFRTVINKKNKQVEVREIWILPR